MSRTTLGWLLALVAAHVVLAVLYASVTPYRSAGVLLGQRGPDGLPQRALDIGAPDERQHANYVQHLLDGKGFPVFRPGTPDLYETYQAHQPPLYYVLAAGWAKVAGVGDVAEPAGVRLRWLNALIGAAFVAGAFFCGWWGFRKEEVGLGAAAVVSLLPMNAALSGAVSNDPLLYALCTWVLALLARGLREGWTLKLAVTVGVLTGLALLTKTTAVALLPVLLLAVLIPQASRPKPAFVAAAAVLALLIPAGWWARNQSNYGDPLAIRAFNEAFAGSPSPAVLVLPARLESDPAAAAKFQEIQSQNPGMAIADVFRRVDQELGSPSLKSPDYWLDWVGWWTARSFFGVFGYMDVFLNERGTPATNPRAPNTVYRLLLAGFALLALAWILSLKLEWVQDARSVQIVNGVFLALVVILFVRFNTQYFQGQARYLFPALAPLGVGFTLGALALLKERSAVAVALISGVLALVNALALSRLPEEFAKRTL